MNVKWYYGKSSTGVWPCELKKKQAIHTTGKFLHLEVYKRDNRWQTMNAKWYYGKSSTGVWPWELKNNKKTYWHFSKITAVE
jgi:hypothetical protein